MTKQPHDILFHTPKPTPSKCRCCDNCQRSCPCEDHLQVTWSTSLPSTNEHHLSDVQQQYFKTCVTELLQELCEEDEVSEDNMIKINKEFSHAMTKQDTNIVLKKFNLGSALGLFLDLREEASKQC